ncbi:MAG: TIGR03435 family protein [Bryobacterales bacterium]|nr:TIGR03435 family protein [Bryobacterales bacterium]MDE0296619.1 TIGR03435 family protein [Bryobacterales bacterium]
MSLLPAEEIKVGYPAPPLTLDRILQSPPGTEADWQQLQGKAVVIEFWATWCPGCREKIPQLNRLIERFAARPVQFISITDEDIDLVTRFLKDQPIAGWVGLDSDGTTFESYGVIPRPFTVLVDASGIVRAATGAGLVTDSIVEALIAGEPLGITEESESHDDVIGQALADTLFELSIRPAGPVAVTEYSPGAIVSRGGRFEGYGLTVRILLAMAYGLPEDRVVAPSWCDESRYDVVLASPLLESSPDRRRLIRQVLTETFRVEVKREARHTEVYVLQKTLEKMPVMKSSEFSSHLRSGKRGNFKVTGGELRDLARLLQRELDRPVLDETGLKGRYDFELLWDIRNPISILDFVRDNLGLELRPKVREMEHLIVQSIERAVTW